MDNNLDKDYEEMRKIQSKRNEYNRIFKNSFQSQEVIAENTFVVKEKTNNKPKTNSKKWAMIGIIGIMLSTGIVVHSNADNIDKAQDYLKDRLKNPMEQERLHNESVISDAVDSITQRENEAAIEEIIKQESEKQRKESQIYNDTSSTVGIPGIVYEEIDIDEMVEETGRSY